MKASLGRSAKGQVLRSFSLSKLLEVLGPNLPLELLPQKTSWTRGHLNTLKQATTRLRQLLLFLQPLGWSQSSWSACGTIPKVSFGAVPLRPLRWQSTQEGETNIELWRNCQHLLSADHLFSAFSLKAFTRPKQHCTQRPQPQAAAPSRSAAGKSGGASRASGLKDGTKRGTKRAKTRAMFEMKGELHTVLDRNFWGLMTNLKGKIP